MKLPGKSAHTSLLKSNNIYKTPQPMFSTMSQSKAPNHDYIVPSSARHAAEATVVKFMPPQKEEIELTQIIQSQNWVDSFSHEIITAHPDIKKEVDQLRIAQFRDYSGVLQPGFLGKFFYIARYIDEVDKTKYQDLHLDIHSPLYTKKNSKVEFDAKPWRVNWDKIPDYTKNHIFKYRTDIGRATGKSITRAQDFGRENAEEYKASILASIGGMYNALEESEKLDFVKTAALAGTSNPLIQAQSNNKIYIQGYIMNILELNSRSIEVVEYYRAAIDNGMGLLSGPSGTSHRTINLVRELQPHLRDRDNLGLLKLKTTALCLAALGVPYNCHSFYEIVTVVIPDDTSLHSVANFRRALESNDLLL